jgi:hypothetical protein
VTDKIVPPESFGVASWFVLRALLAEHPKSSEILDRVLLSLERLQKGETDELADWYAGARVLVDEALKTTLKR